MRGSATIFRNFHHDLNNPATNTPSEDIKSMVAGSGARHEPVAFTISHKGCTRIYTHLSRYQENLHEPQPALVGR